MIKSKFFGLFNSYAHFSTDLHDSSHSETPNSSPFQTATFLSLFLFSFSLANTVFPLITFHSCLSSHTKCYFVSPAKGYVLSSKIIILFRCWRIRQKHDCKTDENIARKRIQRRVSYPSNSFITGRWLH